MIEIILFILPTFFALIIHDKLNHNEKNLYSIVKTFGGYCCLINLLLMCILFLYRTQDFEIQANMKMFDFTFKYFVLASVVATVLPIILEFIKRNVSLQIVFKEKENENKENNN